VESKKDVTIVPLLKRKKALASARAFAFPKGPGSVIVLAISPLGFEPKCYMTLRGKT
jgi:hypothetical protein